MFSNYKSEKLHALSFSQNGENITFLAETQT